MKIIPVCGRRHVREYRAFYVAVLAALGAPLRPRQRLAELEQATLMLLRAVGVRMLVIDELHNVLAGRGDVRREFLNLMRFLGNELRIPRTPARPSGASCSNANWRERAPALAAAPAARAARGVVVLA